MEEPANAIVKSLIDYMYEVSNKGIALGSPWRKSKNQVRRWFKSLTLEEKWEAIKEYDEIRASQ